MGDVDGSPVGMMVYEVGDVDLHKAIHPDTDGPGAGDRKRIAGFDRGGEHLVSGSHIADDSRGTGTAREV